MHVTIMKIVYLSYFLKETKQTIPAMKKEQWKIVMCGIRSNKILMVWSKKCTFSEHDESTLC